MTASAALQVGALPRRAPRPGPAARLVHGAGLPGRNRRPHASVLGPQSSGCSTACAACVPDQEMRLQDYALAVLAFNAAGLLARLRPPAAPGRPAAEPAKAWRADRPTSRSTPPASFATNTNWQSVRRRERRSATSRRCSGSRVQNFVSAATGMAVLVALIRGFTRTTATPSAASGSTSSEHALHPPAALARARAAPRLAGRRADVRPATARAQPAPGRRRTPTAGTVTDQVLADRARRPRRSRSSSSAPTAAASST